MRKKKNINEIKIKFTICVDPKIHEKMEIDLINKSKLIEKLLKEYYDKKDL